ncbi:MAG: ABC transporter permease [Clostridiaceae bacterium BRH_c20a]|nr:MAG: ABC transporter permease [Clostridiaceae bacterium BRH_c20a]
MLLGLLLLFVFLLIIGVPVFYILSSLAVYYIYILDLPLKMIPQRFVAGADSFVLLAVPFFILAGELMNNSGITTRIFDFCSKLVGHIKGGLGHVNILASIIFSGMSGSALADAAGLGLVEVKAMVDAGWHKEDAAAVTVASATIGPIIPPSIPLVIYGVVAEQSIGRLFLGGVIPGLLLGITMMVLVYIIAGRKNFPVQTRASLKSIFSSFISASPALLMPVFILGFIALGITSPTEAGLVAVAYSLILGFFIYKELTLANFMKALNNTVKTTTTIMIIVCAANLLGWVITIQRAADVLATYTLSITENPVLILLAVNLLLIVVGCFMESISALLIFVPLLLPVLTSIGIDPIHFGVVMVLNLMIGLVTPPFGMSVFVMGKVANLSPEIIFRSTLIYYIPLFGTLLLVTLFPSLVTWIPNLLF